ncbi:MAG TPA: Hsp20/alpha crystallin family protein [Candidatus Dojkabacteria bacterium]
MTLWDPYKVRRMIDETWGDDFGMNWDDNELDMYEEEGKFVIKLKAPGFDDKNVDITIDANSVTIMGKAEKEEEEEDKKRKYYKKELVTKSFTRTVNLPRRVIAENAKANFKSGILVIELPKSEDEMPKKINIKADSK